MKSFIVSSVLLILFLLPSCMENRSYDILIKGGRLIDGSGSPEQKADLGITGGKIVAIGNLEGSAASRMIDASGKIVSPGFIDLHTHIETIMNNPDLKSHVMQGVTTVLGGPDGGGPWPFGKYIDSLGKFYRISVNVAYLTGHNVIRSEVMNNDNRKPTDEELIKMKDMVKQAMHEGAFGLSTGLKYMPGSFAATPEITELARVASGMGGIYTSHLREEGLGLIEGVREAITIGKEAGIPVVLTHHKAMGKPMWGKSLLTTGLVDSARKAGIDVMMDQYPYTASFTSLSVLIPTWAMAGRKEDFLKRVANAHLHDSIISGIKFNILNDRGGGDIRLIQLGTVEWDTTLNGKTLYDYAVRSGLEPTPENGAVLVLEMQLKGGAQCIYHALNDDDVERIMKHPFTMIASDGGEGFPHPRAYGTFPRILGHYVREKHTLTLPDAIRKMTSLPAARMGLKDRGLIKKNYVADITIFDPEKITDRSTYLQPHLYPEGIDYVIVNGIITVDKGELSKNRAGKLLRGPAYKVK
jgi:N-acyl-D-amino-acid deacylase